LAHLAAPIHVEELLGLFGISLSAGVFIAEFVCDYAY